MILSISKCTCSRFSSNLAPVSNFLGANVGFLCLRESFDSPVLCHQYFLCRSQNNIKLRISFMMQRLQKNKVALELKAHLFSNIKICFIPLISLKEKKHTVFLCGQ
jgi:hypothetical protein